MKTKKYRGQKLLDYMVMAVVVLISTFPFLWVLLSSFKTNNQILSSSFSLPTSLYLDGYKIAMEKVDIFSRFLTSLTVAGISTLLAVVIYSMAGYVLARCRFRGKNVMFLLLISSMLIPSNAMVQPVYFVVNKLGLYDTKAGLILVYTGFGMAMSLFLMRNFFLSIPQELEDAACIDGAGFGRTFLHVMLPVSKSAMASAAILTFIFSWNEFMYAMLLTSSEKNRTLPLTIKYFTSAFSFNYSSMFAALVLCILPTLVVYVVLQEQIAESMVAGSVKG
ncbi:MAG: carbohydrate ABC transporter permease [Lachnospiraceae bacterium]|jgi:raffinose/stachyose/melibiose transport system permease protein|nr:carbohydrate ABC transporter permease [Lachnospiraceae bacterium]MCI8995823.1 carbohydrate ABC transporter permease [Lachnospiraceae bacterium]MCI9133776.1 carbohydrate ABC transporter permease [Lachnospiraceae bacterium]